MLLQREAHKFREEEQDGNIIDLIEFYAVSSSNDGSGNNTETTVNDNMVLKNNEF